MYISAHITALVEHGVGAILSDLHPDLGAVSTGVRDAPFITRAFLHITINLALRVNVCTIIVKLRVKKLKVRWVSSQAHNFTKLFKARTVGVYLWFELNTNESWNLIIFSYSLIQNACAHDRVCEEASLELILDGVVDYGGEVDEPHRGEHRHG